MSTALQCNRCKTYAVISNEKDSPSKTFQQLDYFEKGLGHYYTIHLCGRCTDMFAKFLAREAVSE